MPMTRDQLDQYNVVWVSQSRNSGESMPVGGGDVGLNVWVEDGELLFYIARAGCRDENGALLKLGRVRISMAPNPHSNSSFRQQLVVGVLGPGPYGHQFRPRGRGSGLAGRPQLPAVPFYARRQRAWTGSNSIQRGGLFTFDAAYVNGKKGPGYTPDHRQWGAAYTAQNQRGEPCQGTQPASFLQSIH